MEILTSTLSNYNTEDSFFNPSKVNLHKLYIEDVDELESNSLISSIQASLDELRENSFFSTLDLNLNEKVSAINDLGFCCLFSSSKKNCLLFKATLESKESLLQKKINITSEN